MSDDAIRRAAERIAVDLAFIADGIHAHTFERIIREELGDVVAERDEAVAHVAKLVKEHKAYAPIDAWCTCEDGDCGLHYLVEAVSVAETFLARMKPLMRPATCPRCEAAISALGGEHG